MGFSPMQLNTNIKVIHVRIQCFTYQLFIFWKFLQYFKLHRQTTLTNYKAHGNMHENKKNCAQCNVKKQNKKKTTNKNGKKFGRMAQVSSHDMNQVNKTTPTFHHTKLQSPPLDRYVLKSFKKCLEQNRRKPVFGFLQEIKLA